MKKMKKISMISEICRRLILKVRILKTAKDQKYFEVVCIKNLLPYDLLIYIYLHCVNLGKGTCNCHIKVESY